MDTESAEPCHECGKIAMKKIGDINSTRLFICLECFAERHEFISLDSCEHDYNDKSGNKCIHCGKPSINYAD